MKTNSNLHEGHRSRLKAKFLENPSIVSDHELLEVLLYGALPRVDTNEIAHRLLKVFGSLSGVFSATEKELTCIEGVGPENDLPHSPSFQNVTSRTLSLSAPQRSSLHPKGLLFALTSFPVHCSDHLFKRNSPLSTLRAFFLHFFSGFITFSFTFFPWVPLMTRPSGWPMTAGTQGHLEHRPPAGLPS